MAVLRLRVPLRQREPLKQLAELSPEDQSALVERLRNLPEEVRTRSGLVAAVGTVLPDASADEIVEALVGLHSIRGGQSNSPTTQDIATGIAASDDLELEPALRTTLASVLARLLEVPLVATVGRALDVMFDHERNFQNVRILTDLRPLFEDDPQTGPLGVVIQHILRLGYAQDGALTFDYFALEEEDLKVLADAIDRALGKSQALRKALAGTDLPYVSPETLA